ncbi:UNVERIFIED_CONTAM: hypothetical protein Sradi_3717000 [Sesamum radiatum]|uniref:F-box domain-containing protein n=1 Tax=Sesamum radiatum TaxID=300843 RepID=A0AAW2PXW0_SESRA
MMSESCNIVDHLPQAMLLEIFCRLPIHDVTRCKVVCRAWLNLLSDPNFTNIYTINTPFTTLLLEEMMSWSVMNTRSMKYSLLEVSAAGEYTQTPLAPIEIPTNHLDYDHTSLVLVGSCNGFLCFSYHKYHFCSRGGTSVVKEGLYINNPITREIIELPQYDEMLNIRDNFVTAESHHFGFSPSTGEFKVVRIVYSVASIQPLIVDGKPEIQICTVGVDKKWRNLASLPLIMSNWSNVVTLNGAHHWIVADKIHTFDIGKEQDGPILHLPVVGCSSESSLSSVELLELNNQLALVDNSVLSQITIWTMKEYGVVESWTKHVIFQDSFPTVLYCQKVSPVAMFRNGTILFSNSCHDGHFILYNPKRKECADIQISDVGWLSTAIRFNSYSRHMLIVHPLDELIMM